MKARLKLLLISLLPLFPISSQANKLVLSDVGLRIGIDAENRVSVQSYEIIAHLDSPWSWTISGQFTVDLGFEFGLGALVGEGETGVLTHLGPSIEVNYGDFPITFALSSGPALLSEHEFSNLDLGGSFQFMSAVGFDYALSQKWTLGYRYLHISNAGLHEKNPGMNLHAVNACYKF